MVGRVRIDEDRLIFVIHGVDKVLSIKRSIEVPLNHVVSVSKEKITEMHFKQLRMGGGSTPKILRDGRYWSKDGTLFYAMHNPDRRITVKLEQ